MLAFRRTLSRTSLYVLEKLTACIIQFFHSLLSSDGLVMKIAGIPFKQCTCSQSSSLCTERDISLPQVY